MSDPHRLDAALRARAAAALAAPLFAAALTAAAGPAAAQSTLEAAGDALEAAGEAASDAASAAAEAAGDAVDAVVDAAERAADAAEEAVSGDDAAPAEPQIGVSSGAYALDPAHASLVWRVKHLGLSYYTGRMTDMDVVVTLDVAEPNASKVVADINPLSVDTPFQGPEDFDGKIATDPRLLNADAHPAITFVSTAVERTGTDTATITGDLSLLGLTREITLEATLNGALASHPLPPYQGKEAIGFTARTVIDRSAFGMTFPGPSIVGAEVEIIFDGDFVKTDAAAEASEDAGEADAAAEEAAAE